MKKVVLDILHRKKIQTFFLFYIIMILPLLTILAENLSVYDVVLIIAVNSGLFFSMSALSVFWSSKAEKIIYSGVFIISYLPFLIYTGYLLFARVLLQKNSIISLFETNPEESREFMTHYFNPWIVAAGVAYILVCFLVVWVMKSNKRLRISDHKTTFWISLAVILLVICVPQLSKNVYFINFYKLYASYKRNLNKEELAIKGRQTQLYDVKTVDNDTVPKTIVVVIGESLTRDHMSLYGYKRNTNPKLSQLGDSLLVYSDVISPQVHTIPVMRSVLTFADKSSLKFITEKPSLFELFNRAGYETYFITNQPFSGRFSTSYDALLKVSKHVYNLSEEKLQDEIVLPCLNDILSEKSSKNKLILIHLIGNHMAYEFRYTPVFNIFNNSEDHKIGSTPFRDKRDIHTIDKYDNSVLYNDFVLNEMINLLKFNSNNESALIYFSDHGEEVFDYRKFAGHAYEKVSTYMCDIPFLVWTSPRFIKNREDLVFDTKRPYSTVDFIFSLSNLSGLYYKDYNPQKSIFSASFLPDKRYVGDYSYEKVIEKTDKNK